VNIKKKTPYVCRGEYFIILNCKGKSRMQPFLLSVYTMFHSWVQWNVTKSKVAKLVSHSTLEPGWKSIMSRKYFILSSAPRRRIYYPLSVYTFSFMKKKCACGNYTKWVLVFLTRRIWVSIACLSILSLCLL